MGTACVLRSPIVSLSAAMFAAKVLFLLFIVRVDAATFSAYEEAGCVSTKKVSSFTFLDGLSLAEGSCQRTNYTELDENSFRRAYIQMTCNTPLGTGLALIASYSSECINPFGTLQFNATNFANFRSGGCAAAVSDGNTSNTWYSQWEESAPLAMPTCLWPTTVTTTSVTTTSRTTTTTTPSTTTPTTSATSLQAGVGLLAAIAWATVGLMQHA